MAKGGSGQLSFDDAVVRRAAGANARLEKIDALVDWSRVERLLAPVYSSPVGQESYPVLTLFKAQLLGQWYGLSDPELDAPVPDHSTLWRFRDQLASRQLAAHGLMVKQGTLLDATLVQAQARPPSLAKGAGAGSDQDRDADWTRQHGRSHFGYKVHAGVDQGSQLIRTLRLSPASCNESALADQLVCGDERAVYADKAYEHKVRRARLKARGIKDRIMHRADKHYPQLGRWQQRRNAGIRPIRAAVERVFGTLKRSYGLGRMRAFSLAANRVDVTLTAIAYNLRRAERLCAGP